MISDFEEAITHAADAVGPAVTGVGGGPRRGSGLVVAPDRVLVAARHLRGPEPVVWFADGRRETATVHAVDADAGTAVLAVTTGKAPAVAWAQDPPRLGQAVFAVARQSGGLRITLGFVSALDGPARGARGRCLRGSIEHTAAVARGSGGGPLVDAQGQVLGVNHARLDGGLSLAAPADETFRARIAELAEGRAPARRSLGVAVVPPRAARRMRAAVGLEPLDGLLVQEVELESPAAAAGVEAGDLLVEAGGRPISSTADLYAALDAVPGAGGEVVLGIVRGSDRRTATARVGGDG